MAEPSKWEKTLSALNAPPKAEAPTVLLPIKPPRESGKRSTPGWKQKSVLLKEESVYRATERLKRRGDKTDFSDLVQALLDAWLDSPSS
jgi:hypothetical protein